jgi:hypothetical protein
LDLPDEQVNARIPMRVSTEAGKDLPEAAQDLNRQPHEPVNSRKQEYTRNHIFFGGGGRWGAHLTSLHDPSLRPPALLCCCCVTSTQPQPDSVRMRAQAVQ